ncbi:MAG: PAS domain-containing protein [Candidatus Omnitrophica bacterium]|nr:PAS domain-containing protein [Candidatus Omnitrophota bacterium]
MGDSKKNQTVLISDLEDLQRIIGDIERKLADRERIVNDIQLFKSIVDASPEAIALYNAEGGIVYSNAAHENLFHRPLEESLQLNETDFFPPESIDILKNQIRPALIDGRDWEGELTARDAQGRLFPLWLHQKAFLDEEGDFLYSFGVMHDLSDRKSKKWACLSTFPLKKAESQISGVIEHVVDISERKQSDEALQTTLSIQEALLSTIPAFVYLKDKDLKYICVNQTYSDFIGLSREEILDRCDFDFFPKQYAEKFRSDDIRIMKTNTPALNYEEKVETLDGKVIWASTSKTPLRNSNGCAVGIVGVSMDVTEKKRWEEHFRQAQKMEAVGHLAGGVAHNVNNLLTGIIGNLSIALMKAPSGISDYLRKAQDASQRAADLADNLLAFSRNSELKLKQLNVNQILEKVYDLARQTIDRRIDLQINLEEDLPPVSADPAQISTVLMNLCINARDAVNRIINENIFPHRKDDRFEIRLESALLDPLKNPCAARKVSCAGPIVVLRVSDNGIGMDKETQKRIFEPFFTTQKTVGAGLGLASAFGSVAQHNGWIDFTSEYGVGTTFNVYLPASRRSEEVDAVEQENTGRIDLQGNVDLQGRVDLQGNECILIVDDEETILHLAKEVLEENGYGVLLAKDGQQGLDLYFQERDRIDLILLDLSMPKVSGREFLKKTQNTDSSIKIIVSSGYSSSVDVSSLKNLGVCGMLSKPYYPRDLLDMIRRSLDGVASLETA